MIKDYCTQNNGNCETCSLASYGRDCMNNPIKETKDTIKLSYNKDDFFDNDGWIRFDGFSVAVGEKGELEYCNPLKNKSYYEQNPYYQVIQIREDENNIQDSTELFEKKILEKKGGEIS
jgi:hypothetical protein